MNRSTLYRLLPLCAVFLAFLVQAVHATEPQHTSNPFQGVKANTGTVIHSHRDGKSILTLSEDFKVPDTPDPHFQVVDSKGEIFLLQALKVKDGKVNREVEVPRYVRNVARVQIWCAFAETLLGEATFPSPVK